MDTKFLIRLERKQLRVVSRSLQELFSKRSLEPMKFDRSSKPEFLDVVRRSVKVTADGRKALMSTAAIQAFERAVDTLAEASAGSTMCTRNDIASAARAVYESCWQSRQVPETAGEFVDLVCAQVESAIDRRTVVAVLRGVELSGVAEMPLGSLRLMSSVKEYITEAGVQCEDSLEGEPWKRLLSVPCLVGSHTGTPDAAKRWYREQALLAAGMLAVDAGASYERAATSFYIEPEFERPSGSASVHLFWGDRDKYLGRSFSFGRSQNLMLSAERVAELTAPGAFEHAFRILQSESRSELEDAVTRAVYWYGDAHRDAVRAMQFVKYWSCLECLLGGPGEELTETLALGVVAVLTFGNFRLLDVASWRANVCSVKRLYALRSRAVHRASHSHVTFTDLVMLATWTAWVIYNAISFSHAGMPDLRTLWREVKQVASSQPGFAAGAGAGPNSDANV